MREREREISECSSLRVHVVIAFTETLLYDGYMHRFCRGQKQTEHYLTERDATEQNDHPVMVFCSLGNFELIYINSVII